MSRIDNLYLGNCKVFIRVIAPDGTVFDAIGETEQLTIKGSNPAHYNPFSEYYDDRILHRPGFPYYTDMHMDISQWMVSKQDAPVEWKEETRQLSDVEVRRLNSGNAGQ